MPDRYRRRDALKLLGSGALGLSLAPLLSGCADADKSGNAQPQSRQRPRPNILFFLTDDQTQGAMGAYGNTILKTPSMDRIGNEGIRFSEAFVTCSLCVPSRASYLTGQYPHRHGLLTQGVESGFPGQPPLRNDATWPLLLRQAGYRTAVIGKWHIETPPQGYDYAAVLPGHGVYFDPPMFVNGAMTRQHGHADDVIGDLSLRFLRDAAGGGQPFCLLCQFKAPHRDWEPAPRFSKMFEDVEIPIPPTFEQPPATEAVRKSEMRIADMPDFRKRGVPATLPPDERERANFQTLVKNYYRVLLGVDENVGKLLDFLDESGLAENTIVVYGSDNGFFLGEHGLFDKRLMYEPSIRVPMLLRWPAMIDAGRVDDRHMVLNIDVAPTLLDLAGAPVPETMQGTSWRPLLEANDAPWREDFLYEFYEFPAVHCVRKHRGVRDARWKLIHFWQLPEEWELYDLGNDPDERRNLAADPAHAAQLRRMQARLAELRSESGDVDPPGHVPARPETGRCPA